MSWRVYSRKPRLIGSSGMRWQQIVSRMRRQISKAQSMRHRQRAKLRLVGADGPSLISAEHQGSTMPSKPVNVRQVLVYLTHAQHAALRKLKDRLDIPMSEMIRKAIDRYLKQMESRK